MDTTQTIRGDLAAFSLPDLLQTLQQNASSGTLTLHGEEQDHFAYLSSSGGICLLYRVEPFQIEAARKLMLQGQVERPAAELLSRGMLEQTDEPTREKFRQQLERAALEGLYDVFRITSGKFTFRNGVKRPETKQGEALAEGGSYQITALLMEALRRADEWGRMRDEVPWLGEIPLVVAHPAEPLPEPTTQVLGKIDGKTPIGELVLRSPFERFDYCSQLAYLVRSGAVRYYTDEELLEQASAGKARDPELALQRLALLLRRHPEDAEHAGRYAEALEDRGQRERAAEVRRRQAEILAGRGELQRAQEILAGLLPGGRDVTRIRRRLIDIALESHAQSEQPAFELGPVIASELEKLRSTGAHAEALALIERVIELQPDVLEHRQRRINVLLDLDRKADATGEYEQLAGTAVSAGDTLYAATCLRKILALDRNRNDIRRKLDQLEQDRSRQQGQASRKRLLVAVPLALLLVAAGVVAAGYQRWSASSAEAARLEPQQPELARSIYRSYADSWWFLPWAVPAREAAERLDRALAKLSEQRLRANTALLRTALEQAAALYAKSRLKQALARLEPLADRAPVDAELGRTRDSTLERYRTEWKEAARQKARAAAHERAGEYERAFGAYLLLQRYRAAGSLLEGVTLPLQVTINCAPVTVTLEGRPFGTFDKPRFVLRLPPRLEGKLRFAARGHAARTVDVAEQTGTLELALARTAEWRYRADGAIVAPLAQDAHSLYVATKRNRLDRVGLGDGRRLWRSDHSLAGEMLDAPIVLEQRVYVLSNNGRLHEIDTTSGRPTPASPVYKGSIAGTGTLLIRRPWPAILFGTRSLVAFDLRERRTRTLASFDSPLVGQPTPGPAGMLHLATENGELVAFSLDRQTTRWVRRLGSQCRGTIPTWSDTVLAATQDGRLLGLDLGSGEIRWSMRLRGALSCGSLSGNRLLVSSSEGLAVQLELGKGKPREVWRHEEKGVAFAPAVLPPGEKMVYLGGSDGRLRALSAADGTLAWSFQGEGAITAPPLVAGERVYFGTGKQQVYAVYRH